MTLDQIRRGQRVNILSIPDERVRVQAIRFGFIEGVTVACAEIIPGGPVILTLNNQEIALGRRLAVKIEVGLVPAVEKKLNGGTYRAVS